MSLSRSVVVKFDYLAQQVNERLKKYQGIEADETAPETWKYYMHLAGEYHSTDVMMQVKSLDTYEIIDFTKANLLDHRQTAREYAPGTLYYNNLIRQYPDQTSLINGILHPIDKQTAIESNNGVILYYDPDYVEENEYTFIYELQEWVDTFILRWYNDQFNLVDELYLSTFLGHFYQRMPLAIMLIRLRAANTNEAHSYHIREFLASHGRLDEFIPYLTKEQQLYLYRNIAYLLRNAGKQEIFDELVEKILTKRGIPLVEMELKQNTVDMPNSIYSSVDVVKSDINFRTLTPETNKTTVGVVLEREADLARDNALVQYDTELEIEHAVSHDKFSELPTKVFDSAVVDRSASAVRTRTNVLLNQWLHLASSGMYRAYVNIPNPRDGELMTVSVKDAFIMMIYAWAKRWGLPVENIPKCIAYEVMRTPLPTTAELRGMVDKRLVNDNVIRAIQDRISPMGSYISTEQFYLDCNRFHQEYLRCWELYSFQEHPLGRALCENVVKAHYIDRMCTLAPANTKFDDYFNDIGLEITDLMETEYEQLVISCVSIATGQNLFRVITMGEIQRELLRLMSRLSSYPLQFLRNVAFTNFHVLGIIVPRVGDVSAEAEYEYYVNLPYVTVRHYWSEGFTGIQIPDYETMPNVTPFYEDDSTHYINPNVCVNESSMRVYAYRFSLMDTTIGRVTIIEDVEAPTDGKLIGYTPSTDPNWPEV